MRFILQQTYAWFEPFTSKEMSKRNTNVSNTSPIIGHQPPNLFELVCWNIWIQWPCPSRWNMQIHIKWWNREPDVNRNESANEAPLGSKKCVTTDLRKPELVMPWGGLLFQKKKKENSSLNQKMVEFWEKEGCKERWKPRKIERRNYNY